MLIARRYVTTTIDTVEVSTLKYLRSVGSVILTILPSRFARNTPIETKISMVISFPVIKILFHSFLM